VENNNSNTQLNYIAIVGMSGRFPAADTVEQFWQNLVDGRQSSTDLSDDELRASGVPEHLITDPDFVKKSYIIDNIDQFDASFFGFTPRDAQITDPQQRLLLECSYEAIENAGYSTDKYDGLVGVYAGIGSMSYYIRNLLPDQQLLDSVGPLRMSIGNEKSFASTMVSFKLDLKGPSVNVDTACSTSLVAVHQACQSLLSYECDMALAGGVSLDIPQKIGMHYKEGSIISPDGKCRPFDADAKGTVKGNGAGIVVLKRLVDAIEDGDTIYAVVKGTAINNDGSLKVGYTASSIEGQAEVITEALSRAEIDPASMRFIEAHGTGTILGDPIEINALSQVYQQHSDDKGFCAVGSVKANVGHLDIAAGVAGVIKSTMALHHKVLPPSINYESANPNIDFENSPFFVNTKLLPLVAQDQPIHAGVSSFGIGGSNAHVILGQSPAFNSEPSSRDQQLLVVSAKSQTSLDNQLISLGKHFATNKDINLADAAYTLQLGRNEYPMRAAVVGRDLEKLSQTLEQQGNGIATKKAERENANVYFMFPGQGAQHLTMTADLYNSEPVFGKAVDECARLFATHLGFDIKDVIFGNEDESKLNDTLNSTLGSQPALFTIEYAMAQLWLSLGVQPNGMIGHSLGEYVAACLAGVFSVEDATKLISKRATLMNAMKPGSMLMVHLSAEDAAPYINDSCCLAANNGPNICVLSADTDTIEGLFEQFEQQQIVSRILHTSHAFHSHMLEPMLNDFAAAVGEIDLQAPNMPYISNVSGDWIDADQATSPQYWVSHLRGTVQFGKGVNTILQDKKAVLLEVGPGQVLTTLTKRSFGLDAVVPSARHAKDSRNDVEHWLNAVGNLWLEGVNIDWQTLHNEDNRRRIALPTYQFDKQTYWVGIGQTSDNAAVVVGTQAQSRQQTEDLSANKTATDLITHLWQEAFGLERIAPADNFFALGGDSLLATQIIALIRQHLNVRASLSELFESADLAQFCAFVEAKVAAKVGEDEAPLEQSDGIKAITEDLANRHEPFPLTDIQQAYWVGRTSALDLGDVATHIYLEVDIKDGDPSAFESSWNQLIKHHDMLRAIFTDTGEQQIIETVPEYIFDVIDLTKMDDDAVLNGQLELRNTMSHQVIPCDSWPLFDIKVATRTERQFRLCISIDVLIADAWSMNMLIEQWLHLYRDASYKLQDMAFSFRDYVIGEHALRDSELYYKNEEYWFDRIDTLPGAPALPLEVSPTAIETVKFERRVYEMAAPRWAKLKKKAAAFGVTPTSLLIGAFSEVLSLWSQNSHFTLALTNYARHPFHEDVDHVVGDFTSLTLLEVNNAAEKTFIQRTSDIQQQLWTDLDNRLVSAVHVLREMSKRRNDRIIMPVVFTSTLGGRELDHEQGMDELGEEVYGVSQSSQVWLDHQVMEWQGKLKFNWDSVDELFPEAMVQSMFDVYCQFIECLVDDEQSWNLTLPITTPSVAVPMEVAPIDTRLLHSGLSVEVAKQPDQVALIHGDTTLTYAELDNAASQVAFGLVEHGIVEKELVAVIMDKGWQQVAAVHGILRAGGAYIPIDADWPEQRQRGLLETTNAKLIVSCPDSLARTTGLGCKVICIEDSWPKLALPQGNLPQITTQPDDLAYVIFTSGSTGKPKGVMIDHQGAMNTIRDINERFDVTANDRIFGLSALSFDLSVYDVFAPYFIGAGLVLPDANSLKDPAHWDLQLNLHDVTIWNTVPALLQMLTEFKHDSLSAYPALRLAMLSGDWIPLSLPDEAKSRLNNELALISLGGATECSIWSVFFPVDEVLPQWKSIPYGKGLSNQRLYVLNERLGECPVGVTGDIFISGIGLAIGYYKDEQKTNDHFIVHPRSGERLYRTGDCGRYYADGLIEFLGRQDNQVKVNGFRIELGEIETAIINNSNFEDAVVVALGGQDAGNKGRNRLVAYLVDPAIDDSKKSKLVEFKLSKPGIRKSLPEDTVQSLPPVATDLSKYKWRKSYREYLGAELTLNRFSQMLGCLSEYRCDELTMPKYRYPSSGSLNPIQTYVHVKANAIAGLEGGFYYYHAVNHHLVRLACQNEMTTAPWGKGDNPNVFERAAFSLFLVGESKAIEPVYGQEGANQMMLLEAGYMSQLLMEESPTQHIGLCPIGYIDKSAEQLLELSESQTILHSILGGSVTTQQIECWSATNTQAEKSANTDKPLGNTLKQRQENLVTALGTTIPSYMMPSAYVMVDKLPLTANGKVDRKALVSQGYTAAVINNKVEAKNPMEKSILSIWQQVLGFDDFGTQDSFFEIGGDSVMILKIHQHLCQQLNVSITVVDLFKYPKIADLASFLSTTTSQAKSAQKPVASNTTQEHKAKAQKQKAAIGRQRKLAKGRA
jgi:amino acid adenylation domain-containing protein